MSQIDNISGFGPINAQAQAEYVISQLANPYNQAVTALQQVINTPYSTPAQYTAAYQQVMQALAALKNLSENGVLLNISGLQDQYYLPQNLAQLTDVIVRSLLSVGITLSTPISNPGEQQTAIQTWQNLKGYGIGQALIDALNGSGATAINSLQSFIELQYVKAGNDTLFNSLSGLQVALSLTNDMVTTLTGLQNAMNQVQAVQGAGSPTGGATSAGDGSTSFTYPPITAADIPGATLQDKEKLLYGSSTSNGIIPVAGTPATGSLLDIVQTSYGSSAVTDLINAWNDSVTNATSLANGNPDLITGYLRNTSAFGGIFIPMIIGNYSSFDGIGSNLDAGAIYKLLSNNGTISSRSFNTGFNVLPTSLADIPSTNIPSMLYAYFAMEQPFQTTTTNPITNPNAFDLATSTTYKNLAVSYYNDMNVFLSNWNTFMSQNPNATNSQVLNWAQGEMASMPFFSTAYSTMIKKLSSNSGAYTYLTNFYTAEVQGSVAYPTIAPPSTGAAGAQRASLSTIQSAFGAQVPIPVITDTTVPSVITLRDQLLDQINRLMQIPGQNDPNNPSSLLYALNQVYNDLNSKIGTSNDPLIQLNGIISWMMDGMDVITGLSQQGAIQNDLSVATSNAQSLNDSQKQQVTNYMYIFQSFYQSASDTLSQITEILQKTAKRISR